MSALPIISDICEGLYFSMMNTAKSDSIMHELLSKSNTLPQQSYNITSHPFMHSIIFNYIGDNGNYGYEFH